MIDIFRAFAFEQHMRVTAPDINEYPYILVWQDCFGLRCDFRPEAPNVKSSGVCVFKRSELNRDRR